MRTCDGRSEESFRCERDELSGLMECSLVTQGEAGSLSRPLQGV